MVDSSESNTKPANEPAGTPTSVASAPQAAAQPSATGGWQGAFNALGAVFEQIKKNPQPAYLFVGVYTALAVLSFLADGGSTSFNETGSSYESLAALIFLLALPVYSLALADKKVISIGEFMRFDLGRYLTLVAVMLLTVVILVVAAIPLLIPLIWVIPWFALAGYAAVDKKLGPVEALKESKRLAQNHKGKVWGIIGSMILLAIAAGILSFIPVVGAAVAAFVNVLAGGAFASLYRWLERNVSAA